MIRRLLPVPLAAWLRRTLWLVTLALFGCATPVPHKPSAVRPPARAPAPPGVGIPKPPAPALVSPAMRPARWSDLPRWNDENPALAWQALNASCKVLEDKDAWRTPCAIALQVTKPDAATARRYFESYFKPYQLVNPDGGDTGLATGYYEPVLQGSLKRTQRYRYPVYGVPDDLLDVDLASVYPQLKGMRLRGRLEGRRVVPYYDRAQIASGVAPLHGKELAWVDNALDLFFLQIQGSGRIKLRNGQVLRVGYADQNGYPYRSIGRWLVEHGKLPLDKASMQGIKDWARAHPAALQPLLNYNASYVFFRVLPADLPGPLGALGVPLTPGRSVAVDPRYVPLGAPVYLATTRPDSTVPLDRLMLAQDTGGAIRGPVRADFFWGHGRAAGREAGRMKQALRMWVLLPDTGATTPGGND